MASPFPGMDPFVEGQAWTDFHLNCLSQLQATLAPLVLPGYVVRVYVEHSPEEGRSTRPDLLVAGARGGAGGSDHPEPVPRPVEVLLPLEQPRRYLEIRRRARGEVVTVLELLSPANKRRGSDGRRVYLEKRDAILQSRVHLVEIDLLRGGERLPMAEPLPAGDCYVVVSRAHRRPRAEVWPIGLRQPLPSVAIPLGDDQPDVILNLQDVFTAVYDRALYGASLDYAAEVVPALPDGDLDWTREVLATAGL